MRSFDTQFCKSSPTSLVAYVSKTLHFEWHPMSEVGSPLLV